MELAVIPSPVAMYFDFCISSNGQEKASKADKDGCHGCDGI